MTDESPFQLVSLINVSGSKNGICIPLFIKRPENFYYIPTTNNNLEIQGFQVCLDFERKIRGIPHESIDKTQYIKGDTLPIILISNDEIKIISGDNILDIEAKLERDSSDEISQEALANIRYLIASNPGVTDFRQQNSFWPMREEEIPKPVGARLWLDKVVQELEYIPNHKINDIEKIRGEVRLSLLAWAQELAEHATSPIFYHFVSAVTKAHRMGVYTEDLMATAILKRVSENIARKDRIVDLIRDFRDQYHRGPLESVQNLAEIAEGPVANRATKVLNDYYEYVKLEIDRNFPYFVLLATFLADRYDQWPFDVKDYFSSSLVQHKKILDGLIKKRTEILHDYSIVMKAPQLSYRLSRSMMLKMELSRVSKNMLDCLEKLDCYTKIIKGGARHLEYDLRFGSCDYNLMDLNMDYFATLDMLDTEDMVNIDQNS
jgi:hypothetical protein